MVRNRSSGNEIFVERKAGNWFSGRFRSGRLFGEVFDRNVTESESCLEVGKYFNRAFSNVV